MCDGDTHTHSHTYEYPSFLVTASTSNHRCGYAVRYSTSAHVRTYTRISGSSEQKKEKARLFLLLLPQTAFRISLSLFGVTHTHTHTHVYHISTAYVTQTRVFTLRLLISSYVCVLRRTKPSNSTWEGSFTKSSRRKWWAHTQPWDYAVCMCVEGEEGEGEGEVVID